MRINFKSQGIITMIFVIAGFVVSLWLHNNVWYNLVWIFAGLIFFINPVYPKDVVRLEQKDAEKGIRIASMILVFIGLTNGFGV